tara:strand:+ start:322 stop:1014 length:693 start_codon:yes stop_codon:yes gene_type:complete
MGNYSFQEIFKNSFLAANTVTGNISILEIFLNLFVSLLIGIGIYYVYKNTFQGVLYQKSFGVSLIAITIILTFIIMIIKGNLVLSLGMVGALSVIRFRTPIKDPLDLVFIFWSIAVGISNGVGFFHISFITSLLITIVLFWMFRSKEENSSYLLILQLSDDEVEKEVINLLKNYVKKYSIKSKSTTPKGIEIISEVRVKNNDTSFINKLDKVVGIDKVTLVSSNEDLTTV